jgi:hypothetical protein
MRRLRMLGTFFAEVSCVKQDGQQRVPPRRRRYKGNPVARHAIGPPARSFAVAQDDSKRCCQLCAGRGLLQNAVSYGLELVGREQILLLKGFGFDSL